MSNYGSTLINHKWYYCTCIQLEIPWCSIWTSVPCWALFVCEVSAGCAGYIILTSGAQYMKDVLNVDMKSVSCQSKICKITDCILLFNT